MKYDPKNELSDHQLESLSDDALMEYLDGKAEYLKQFSAPLPGYYLKRYAYIDAANRGSKITDDHHKNLNKMAKEYRQESNRMMAERLKSTEDGVQ